VLWQTPCFAQPCGIINLRHPLVRLAEETDWDFLVQRASVRSVASGQVSRHCRRDLVAGLFILKHMHNLSDERRCERCRGFASTMRSCHMSLILLSRFEGRMIHPKRCSRHAQHLPTWAKV
jgi:hypothetical protein